MQVNQSQNFTFPVILATAFTVSSATVSITFPDGITTITSGATISPNTPATYQTLSTIFTPTIGGQYTGVWNPVVNGQTLSYPFIFFVTWTNAYDNIRNHLGAAVANVADSIIDQEFNNIDTIMHVYANGLSPYWKMNTVSNSRTGLLYSLGYDQGMSLLVASNLRPYLGGKKPSGEITLFKKGTTTIQYSVGPFPIRQTMEDQWREQGMAILEANIPEIFSAALQDRSGDEVMSRGRLAIGNRHPRGRWNAGLDSGMYGVIGPFPGGYPLYGYDFNGADPNVYDVNGDIIAYGGDEL